MSFATKIHTVYFPSKYLLDRNNFAGLRGKKKGEA